MVRVIYRWRVKAGEEDVFLRAWMQGTAAIRTQIKGAGGSLLMRSRLRPCLISSTRCDVRYREEGERNNQEGPACMEKTIPGGRRPQAWTVSLP